MAQPTREQLAFMAGTSPAPRFENNSWDNWTSPDIFWVNNPQQGGGRIGGGGGVDPRIQMFFNQLSQGQNQMANLGELIGNSFGFVNLLNSFNKQQADRLNTSLQQEQIQANAQVEAARAMAEAQARAAELANVTGPVRVQELQNQRFNSTLPALLAAFAGGTGVGGGGLAGFTTPFGQSATLGSAAQKTDTERYNPKSASSNQPQAPFQQDNRQSQLYGRNRAFLPRS